jgi:hypothetical protein
MISRHISCTYTRPVFTVTCPHVQAINVMSTLEYASSWFMFRIRRVYNCLIALNKLLDIVILLPSTRDCSFSILLSSVSHKDETRFIVCLSASFIRFIFTISYSIHQGWSLLYLHRDTKGFPFDNHLRNTSWTPHSHSRKPDPTLPTRPTLFLRSVHFEDKSTYHISHYKLGNDRSFTIELAVLHSTLCFTL